MLERNISKAIKESRWLSIEYENTEGKITKYWIAINDIDIANKRFFVSAFNLAKIVNQTHGLIDITIMFDKIRSAYVIENTSYNQSADLQVKISTYIKELSWLKYDLYNDEILDYIYECMKQEEVAYQKETALVRGIDQNTLEKLPLDGKFELSIEQISDLVPKLETLSKENKKIKKESIVLAINLLSISTSKGLFVVAYKEVSFNPIESSLILSKETLFNYDFASYEFKDFRHNLRNYLDVETDEFIELFLHNPEEARKKLHLEVVKYKEVLDDRPYIFELRRSYYKHIEREINHIKIGKIENKLSIPIEAFFGNMSKEKLKRKKHVDVVILDDRVNIDQLRVIYNSLVQPITYVQGPPGTGKTSTIINVLISAFFNGQKVLLSSNNNKPINDIFLKLQNVKGRDEKRIPLPFLRIGNGDEIINTLNYLRDLLPKIKRFKSDDEKLEIHASNKKEKMKQINELLERYEHQMELIEEIDALKAIQEKMHSDFRTNILVNTLLNDKKKEHKLFPEVTDSDFKNLFTKVDDAFLVWLFFTSVKHIKRIFEPKNIKLLDIINSCDNDYRIKEFNKYTSNDENLKTLQRIFPIILTTNKSVHKLGSQSQHFDLVILDEAGQCSIGPSLFALARGERLLLVGDQNQLKPVISIPAETNKVIMKKFQIGSVYDYLQNSILLTMQKMDTISKFVLLRFHYRSRKDIIQFSNQKYYHNQLEFSKEDKLKTSALEFINVDTSVLTKNAEKNISPLEINQIINQIKEIEENKSIGIITPFRNQAELLKDELKHIGLDHVDVGTIHTFQGDEKDIIYLSSGITKQSNDKTFDWIKDNQELINVATTRARERFILVTDFTEIKKRSSTTNDFYELTQYMKNSGKDVTLIPSTTTKFINGANFKNYNTKKENEFFETINHILTLNTQYVAKQKVRVASILDNFTNPVKHDYGLKSEFDLVIFKKISNLEIPVLVIELDGDEHHNDEKVIRRDKLKEEICKDNQIEIIRIQNDYSRRYLYIKEIFMAML